MTDNYVNIFMLSVLSGRGVFFIIFNFLTIYRAFQDAIAQNIVAAIFPA